MNFALSIIIPFFNAEKTLERLLDSVLSQDTDVNYEVLLINDGSTDMSAEIAESYSEKYHHIKFIHQNKNGVSSARNTGINHSSGEFICFVDADDMLKRNYIQRLYAEIKGYKCDIVVCGYEFVAADYQKERILRSQYFDNISELLLFMEKEKRTFVQSVWNKIFIREIIMKHDIVFNENLSISEDHIFFLEYCKHIKIARTIEDVLYVHIHTENSLTTHRYNSDILINRAENVYYQSNIISSLYPNSSYKQYIFSNYRMDYYYALLEMYYSKKIFNKKNRINRIKQYCVLFAKEDILTFNRRQKMPKIINYFTKKENLMILDFLFCIICQYTKVKFNR